MNTKKPNPLWVHHVGIVVPDLDSAVSLFQSLFRISEVEYEELPDRGLRIALLRLPNLILELITPTREGTAIDRFLQERGGGLHHLSLGVPSMKETLDQLKALGIRVVDGPRPGAFSPRVIFTHPKDTQKVLLEFMEMEPEA